MASPTPSATVHPAGNGAPGPNLRLSPIPPRTRIRFTRVGARLPRSLMLIVRMRFFVGVTDNEWFRFLGGLTTPEEVSFRPPPGRGRLRASSEGRTALRLCERRPCCVRASSGRAPESWAPTDHPS